MAFDVRQMVHRNSHVWQLLRSWPKIELHRHLEGSVRLQTLLEVAEEFDIELPTYDAEQLRPYVQMTREDEASFSVFLSKFTELRKFFCSLEIVRRITREAVLDAAEDNVKYMELRFTPHALALHSGLDYETVIGAVAEEAAKAQQGVDSKVKLIVSVNRHESLEIASAVLDAALTINHNSIVAIDLAGREPEHPAAPFKPIFDRAKENGLFVTIHAGEWEGPENVRAAIEDLGADRIGHGVRAIEDEKVLRLAAERKTPLEICPISNLHTGVVGQPQEHPLLDLAYLNVTTTINTDDPGISNITLTDELMLAHVGVGLTLSDVKENIFNAAKAAFLPADQRKALIDRFQRELGLDDTLPRPPRDLLRKR